jgi:Protein of unknown function (DUF3106)
MNTSIKRLLSASLPAAVLVVTVVSGAALADCNMKKCTMMQPGMQTNMPAAMQPQNMGPCPMMSMAKVVMSYDAGKPEDMSQAHWNTLTPEQRIQKIQERKDAWKAMTPEERQAKIEAKKAAWEAMTPQQRRAHMAAHKQQMRMTPMPMHRKAMDANAPAMNPNDMPMTSQPVMNRSMAAPASMDASGMTTVQPMNEPAAMAAPQE